MLKTRIWTLKIEERLLENYKFSMVLTKIEVRILVIFLQQPKQAISHYSIAERLGRNPDIYKGVCMCISRLNKRFKKLTGGGRLFVSVRNHGFYLKKTILLFEVAVICGWAAAPI